MNTNYENAIKLIENEIKLNKEIMDFEGAYAMVKFAWIMGIIDRDTRNQYVDKIDNEIDKAYEGAI